MTASLPGIFLESLFKFSFSGFFEGVPTKQLKSLLQNPGAEQHMRSSILVALLLLLAIALLADAGQVSESVTMDAGRSWTDRAADSFKGAGKMLFHVGADEVADGESKSEGDDDDETDIAEPEVVPLDGHAPPETHTTLLTIVQGTYELRLSAGQTHTFSFKQQCVEAVVIQVITVNQFLTWVLHVPALQAVVVAFRGTENGENIKSDMGLIKMACRLNSLDCGNVHRGFFTLYRDARPHILAAVHGFLARRSAPISRVYVVGHSLGAAVALIDGLDMAHMLAASRATASLRVSVVTWGCPRVGDARWAAAFGAFRSTLSIVRYQHWRKFMMLKQADPVTVIPHAALGFAHVGSEVQVECKTCSSWAKSHLTRQYLASFERLQGHAAAKC